jgi:TP901 family phage tail tape measure protein
MERSVAVRVSADTRQLQQAMQAASKSTRQLRDEMTRSTRDNKRAMEDIGKVAAMSGAAIVAGVGAAVKSAANFEQAISHVRAATHASAEDMSLLSEAAMEAGARTAFSATEAAGGIEQLAKAGLQTGDILNGGLNGALDLAAAGTIDVGTAAELAATAMTQFKLSGDQVPHVADLLAAAAGKAQGEVTDMGMALKQGGLMAAQTGLSIEETTAALAAFASAGLLGSDAGTSMKTMLQSLTPNSDAAAEKMAEIGFNAFDAAGEFVGLESVAQQLKVGLGALTEEQRALALETMFGSDASRAAAVLYEQGAKGIANWTEAVNDAGYAQETAATKMDNLKGRWEEFTGSLETALITAGTPMLEALSGALAGATEQVNAASEAFGSMPPVAQGAAAGTVAIGGAMTLAGGAALALLPRIVETRQAWGELSKEGTRVRAGMDRARAGATRLTPALHGLQRAGLAAAGIVAVGYAANQIVGSLADARTGANETRAALESLASGGAGLDTMFAGNHHAVDSFEEALGRVADKGKFNSIRDGILGAFGGTSWSMKDAANDLTAIDQSIADLIEKGNIEQATAEWEQLASQATMAGYSFTDLHQALPLTSDALNGVSNQAAGAEKAEEKLQETTREVTSTVEAQTKALDNLRDTMDAIIAQTFGVQEAQDAYRSSVIDLREQVEEAREAGDRNAASLKGNSEAALANREAARGLVEESAKIIQAWADSGISADKLSGKIEKQRKNLQTTLMEMGFSREEARKYSGALKDIKSEVQTKVTTPGLGKAITDIDTLASRISQLTDKKISVDVAYSLLKQESAMAARGGTQPRRAFGGPIHGPGGKTSDSVLMWGSAGEFMQQASAVDYYGLDAMHALNQRRIPREALQGLAAGGPVVTLNTESAGLSSGMASMASALMSGAQDFMESLATFDSSNGWPPAQQGRVAANTAAAVEFVRRTWGINNIGTLGSRPNKSDHPMGKALDVMIPGWSSSTGNALGDEIARWFVSNAGAFGTKHVIWDDEINNGSGWRPYTHPNGATSNPTLRHLDHVHVSVRDQGGALEEGWNLTYNGTGEREWVYTAQQQRAMMAKEGLPAFAAGGLVTDLPLSQWYSETVTGLYGPTLDRADAREAERERTRARKERDAARRELRQAREAVADARAAKSRAGNRMVRAEDGSKVRASFYGNDDDKVRRASDDLKRAREAERDAVKKLREEEKGLGAARANLTQINRRLAGQGRSLQNFRAAVAGGVKDTGAFLRNLTTLGRRGFGVLAQQLAQQGDDEAERIAAQAARASDSTLRAITRNMTTAANQLSAIDKIANPPAPETAPAGPPPSITAAGPTAGYLSSARITPVHASPYAIAAAHAAAAQQPREVHVPTTVVVRDVNDQLIGTMRVEAETAVDSYDRDVANSHSYGVRA